MKEYLISHLVKSEDLNHHGTLYAGRTTEWLIEAGFVTAAGEYGNPEELLCVNAHGFVFTKPVLKGNILTIHGQVVRVGKSSLTVYVKAVTELDQLKKVEGYITFVCVDSKTHRSKPHGIVMDEPENEEIKAIREEANLIAAACAEYNRSEKIK